MTRDDALRYEIHGSWWTGFIGWNWLRELCGAYFARKANRKWRRYQESLAASRRVALRYAMQGKKAPWLE